MSTPDPATLDAIPRDEQGPVFRAPWEAQVFALALLLHERGHFTWTEWTAHLGVELAAARARGERDDGHRYYHHWLDALEKLIAEKGIVLADDLRVRRDAWERAAGETPHGQPIVLPGR